MVRENKQIGRQIKTKENNANAKLNSARNTTTTTTTKRFESKHNKTKCDCFN